MGLECWVSCVLWLRLGRGQHSGWSHDPGFVVVWVAMKLGWNCCQGFMLGSWGRMVWRSTPGVLGSWAMTRKANILRSSMPYKRVWGHCSPGLQSVTFKFCISALGNDKAILPAGLEREQGLPSVLS